MVAAYAAKKMLGVWTDGNLSRVDFWPLREYSGQPLCSSRGVPRYT